MKKSIIVFLVFAIPSLAIAQDPVYTQTVNGARVTTVTISDLSSSAEVNPMIYGQMLEDCNDAVVYGGVVNNSGDENPAVIEKLLPLRIPVMRWPAGTAIYDYEWWRGIGPKSERQPVKELVWGGTEFYTFGTDEFIQWCGKIGAEPYINISMGNNSLISASLGEAVNWVEYVNGAVTSQMGALRAKNGHPEPYGVRLWCIGNENYLNARNLHKSDTAEEYAFELKHWASTLKTVCPDLSLLGVGYTSKWNKVVMATAGDLLDYLTIHYYMTSRIRDDALVDPDLSLFSAALVDESLKIQIADQKEYNTKAGRAENPLRFSIDEWNNRHQVFDGEKYSFTRKDDRRQYDVPGAASMLNVFIRHSPYVAMANYIFPVNGHGLLKTVGENDAYKSCNYLVFDLYRQYLEGRSVGLDVAGPGVKGQRAGDLRMDGNWESSLKDVQLDLCYVDCSATVDDGGMLNLALVNRSYDKPQKVRIVLPEGYTVKETFAVESNDVRAANTAADRDNVTIRPATMKSGTIILKPCGLAVVRCSK